MLHIHEMKKLSAYCTADVPQIVYVPSLQESIQTSSQCAVAILEWVSFKYFVITTCIIPIICPMMASLVSHTALIVKRVLAGQYECKNFLYIAVLSCPSMSNDAEVIQFTLQNFGLTVSL